MVEFFAILADFAVTLLTSLWFWLVLAVTVSFILLRALYVNLKTRALGNVEYSRRFSTDGIFVGETIELIETVENHSWFPLFSVRIDFFVPAGITIDELICREYTKVTSNTTLYHHLICDVGL